MYLFDILYVFRGRTMVLYRLKAKASLFFDKISTHKMHIKKE